MFTGFGDVAERLRRSTVQVQLRGHSAGSGILWNTSGVVLTNAHVIPDTRHLRVELWDKRAYDAAVRSIDRTRDIAALEIRGVDLAAVETADSSKLRAGELVIAVGNPFGFIGALSTGVVHAVSRRWVQASIRLAPGNSGGPLADARGRVIGMNTMMSGPLGLAIPSHILTRFLSRPAVAPTLGVILRPLPGLGLLILEVIPGGAAEAASLLPGDILTGFRSPDDLAEALESCTDGLLRLRFLRGGQKREREVSVQLTESRARAA